MMARFPYLASAVAVTSLLFAVSPLLTRDFAGFKPEQFPVVVDFWPAQPVGWTFGIWGVIYVWLVSSSVWGAIKHPHDPDWDAMRRPLLNSLGIGMFWIAAANLSPILATGMIFVMAAYAIIAMLRAGAHSPMWQVNPVALYAGWLTAATGVGTSVILSGYGILQPQPAALAMLVGVLAVTLFVQSLKPTATAYPIAVIWALVGVIIANIPSQGWYVITLCAIGIATIGLRTILSRR